MEKEKIYNIFNQVAKEASTGKIDAFFIYRFLFATKINGELVYPCLKENVIVPVLTIDNLEAFKDSLVDYINLSLSFYKEETYFKHFDEEDMDTAIKSILTLLWSNASYEDFMNPLAFLQKRKDFFYNKISEYKMDVPSLASNIIIKTRTNGLPAETPYASNITITNGSEKYTLPDVYYGISNNIAYIYGIQSRVANSGLYAKKINRLLYHVNSGFSEESVNDENLKDITPSFVLAANILLRTLRKDGINKVIVNSFLPIRYNNKQLTGEDPFLPDDKKEKYSEDNIDMIQRNMTDKLIRTFRRVAYHHTGIDITSYPMDIDSLMHMTLSESDSCDNELLKETYSEVQNRSR